MPDDDQKPETVDFASQAIQSATFDPRDGSLLITFTSGKEYPFRGVPADLWADWKNSSSPGGFYHDNIKGRFS